MSTYVSGIVWKTELGGATVKAVAMKLADHASDDGSRIYPAVNTIARQAEISPRSAQYALKKLISLGLLVMVRPGGGRHTTEYKFHMPLLMAMHQATLEKWQAEDECTERHIRRTGAKSAPVQGLHRRGATVAPKPSYNHQDKRTLKAAPVAERETKPEAPPKKKAFRPWGGVQVGSLANGVLLCAPGLTTEQGEKPVEPLAPRVVELARGLGAPVESFERETAKPHVKSPTGLFRKLTAKWLGDELPGIDLALANAALNGGTDYRTVVNLLAMRQAST